ncbi:MAG: IclR family transcriptional regulator [Ilumatobacteraceae bacterium]|nr:IclR family transcriptional regulator [Ilumatobacteraceae bacterium]
MESVSGVGVLDKSVLVLHALSGAANGMSLTDLQDATSLPRATAHRLAGALEDHGLVRRNADGRYVLGFTLAALAGAAQRQFPLASAARPVLERLVATTGESVQLYVREGDNRRCVLSLQSPHGLRWIITEGEVYPLGRGSAGHVLAGQALAKSGWIESVAEREAGVASVSAPVRIDGNTIAAVSISGPIERLTRNPGRKFGSAVKKAAAEIESLRPL